MVYNHDRCNGNIFLFYSVLVIYNYFIALVIFPYLWHLLHLLFSVLIFHISAIFFFNLIPCHQFPERSLKSFFFPSHFGMTYHVWWFRGSVSRKHGVQRVWKLMHTWLFQHWYIMLRSYMCRWVLLSWWLGPAQRKVYWNQPVPMHSWQQGLHARKYHYWGMQLLVRALFFFYAKMLVFFSLGFANEI